MQIETSSDTFVVNSRKYTVVVVVLTGIVLRDG